jgi:hypothetical protein
LPSSQIAVLADEFPVVAALGVNALLGERFGANLFRRTARPMPDDLYLVEWTTVLAARIQCR